MGSEGLANAALEDEGYDGGQRDDGDGDAGVDEGVMDHPEERS